MCVCVCVCAWCRQELRELTRLDSAQFVVDAGELEAGLTEASVEETKQHRAKKRMNELLGGGGGSVCNEAVWGRICGGGALRPTFAGLLPARVLM